jgi:hypothetical protein
MLKSFRERGGGAGGWGGTLFKRLRQGATNAEIKTELYDKFGFSLTPDSAFDYFIAEIALVPMEA